jgi:hypothetical protein
LAALLVPVGAFLLWRHAYYGLWLPNTYWAKNPPLDTAIARGSLYLLNTFFTFIYHAYYLPFALGWWLLALAGAASDRFRRPPALLGSLFILVQIVHILRSGGDWMTGWRYMGPVLPLLMLLSVAGIAEIAEGLKRFGQASGPTLARAAIGTLCASFVTACLISYTQDYWKGAHNGLVSWASRGFTFNEREMLRGWGIERAIHLSEWLNAHLPPGSVVVYTEMGVTPYLSPQLRFLDARGLNDHGVATLPGAQRNLTGVTDRYDSAETAVGRYLAEVRKPDYILTGAVVRKGVKLEPQEPILEGRYTPYAEFELARLEPGKTTIMRLWRYQGEAASLPSR